MSITITIVVSAVALSLSLDLSAHLGAATGRLDLSYIGEISLWNKEYGTFDQPNGNKEPKYVQIGSNIDISGVAEF
jgi:hypothetical protein